MKDWIHFMNYCCCSVGQLCQSLCDPMDCSTSGFPVLHNVLEFAKIHVHWVIDAIQLSYPLLPSSPPALNLSQLQGLFQWIGSLHNVAKVLELQLQHQSFQWIFRIDFFRIDWFELLAIQGTQESSSSTVQKHQFFRFQPSFSSNSHIHIWLLEKP